MSRKPARARGRPGRRAITPRKAVLGLLVVVAIVLVVDKIVVTDRERIERLVEDARAAVVRGDWDAVAACVDDEVTSGAKDKASLVSWWRSEWRSKGISTMSAEVLDVEVSGDRAAARVRVLPGAPFTGTWAEGRVHFVRREDAWRIGGVDEVRGGAGWAK